MPTTSRRCKGGPRGRSSSGRAPSYYQGGPMPSYRVAAHMEVVSPADKGFEEGIRIAAKIGYEWVEPMVHTGWELLSEVQYFHSFSMEEDPLLMREVCDRHGVRVSDRKSV